MARKLRVKKKKATSKGFTPYDPNVMPASQYYDPSIDASVAQAQRSNRYLMGDTAGIQGVGSAWDSGDLDAQQRRADEDLAIALQNIQTTRGRGLEDNTRATQNLQRQFDVLANRQQSAFRASGLKGGGVAQALARRQANQAFEQQPIDTSRQRLIQDYGDPNATGDYGTQGRALQLAYTRGGEDRTTQAGRSATELAAYQQDALNSAWAQAQQANPLLTRPTKPKNEFTQGNQTYQLYRIKGGSRKNQLWKRLPSGRLVPRTDMTTLN